MWNKSSNLVLLDEDAPVDENRLKAVLLEWGIDRKAIRRLLKEHRRYSGNIEDRSAQINSSLLKHNPGQAQARV